MQEWVKAEKLKVIILFEGRDAAGKAAGAPERHLAYPQGDPYKKIARDKVKLPKRPSKGSYNDQASLRRKAASPPAIIAS